MQTKNITLKVDVDLYEKYRKLCKKEGWIVPRQFEKFMEDSRSSCESYPTIKILKILIMYLEQ